jgi:hypothetical protein
MALLCPWRLPVLVILLGAACSSPAGPGQQILPGTPQAGTGGSIFGGGGSAGMGNPFGNKPDAAPLPGQEAGAGGTPGTAAVGDKCTASAMCTPGGVCASDVAGGGYCTADCTASGTCPAGASCVMASDTAKICIKTCTMPSHCRSEHICLGGLCFPKCTKDSDCASATCDTSTGQCGTSRVGNACATDASCGQYPAFCDKTRPEGYCSLPCGGPMNIECPADANCVSGGGASTCLKTCATGTNCRPGFLCGTDGGGTKSCIPGCQQNSDCPAGLRCDTATGACGAPPPGGVGGPCTSAANCAALGPTAFCAPQADGFPGGYCSASCDATTCAPPGICVATSATESNCLAPCNAPGDCSRPEYTCFGLKSGPGGVCFPKCTGDADCAEPAPVCDLATGYCAARPTGGTGTSDVIDLTANGPISLNPLFVSDRLSVTIPSDAVSVNFIAQAVSDPTSIIRVARLEQSTDNFATSVRLFDSASINNLVKLEATGMPGGVSVLYPNSPSAPFMVSTATSTMKVALRLGATRATSVKVTAILKRAPSAVVTQGTVDLNLFFVGLPGLNAGSAPADSRFQQVLSQVKSAWGQAGVNIGTVNYVDVTGADAARFSDMGINDLPELMTRTSHPAARDNAFSVFFVHSISADDLGAGFILLGVSAGIPGGLIRGTTISGMAVTTADFPNGLAQIAHTWAHEGGHWLGLYHTTERGGTAFDPLPDTAECSRQRDANGDRILDSTECQGFGADNMMFWTTSAVPSFNITPNQSFVLLRNPAVR